MKYSRNSDHVSTKIRSLRPLKSHYEPNKFASKTIDCSNIHNNQALPDIFSNSKKRSKEKPHDLKEINRKLRIKILVLENRIYNLEKYIGLITVHVILSIVNTIDKEYKERK